MNLLNKLTKKNLKLNKKRTIVTVIGIILSVALITALANLVVSFRLSLVASQIKNEGNYHMMIRGVSQDYLDKIRMNRSIDDIYKVSPIGYSLLRESKNQDKPYIFITAFDYDALNNLGLNLVEGRFPKTSNEIVIPKHLKTNGRVVYDIGETIKLNIGERISNGEVLTQEDSYLYEMEEFKGSEEKEYKIVGVVERPTYRTEPYSAPGYTFITCLDKKSDKYDIYLKYTKKGLKNHISVSAGILGVDPDLFEHNYYLNNLEYYSEAEADEFMNQLSKYPYTFKFNTNLINLEGMSIKDNTIQVIYTVAAIVAVIIMVTSIYCIKNSFNISITEKTKQYGMLASIGATRKQIKHNVLYEAFILGAVGIPLGILCGSLASFILIQVSSYLLKDAMRMPLVFSMSFTSMLVAVILGSITIYFSARKSARKAAKISPIAAIRNNDDVKISSKKIKAPKIIKKLFGIGGEVSYKNLKRNRKKYRTTVISIVVCVAAFIGLSSFVNLTFKFVKVQYGEQRYNLSANIVSDDKEMKDIEDDILELDNIKRIAFYRSSLFEFNNPIFSKEYIKRNKVNEHPDDYKTYTTEIMSLGDKEYRKYVKSLNLNYEEVKDKAIIINNTLVGTIIDGQYKEFEIDLLDYKKNTNISGIVRDYHDKNKESKFSIEVATTTSERPLGLEKRWGLAYFIVSDEVMDKLIKDNVMNVFVDSNNADKLQDDIEKIMGDGIEYYIQNDDKSMREIQSLFTLIAIFLYGFITVIALIGITNIFNTITTTMELRSRELAMLRSIGMTNHEFNRMIRLESFFYGFKSLMIGIPIGLGISYLIYKALGSGVYVIQYQLPIKGIIICVLAVFILIIFIMKYSVNKINKQNIIETIRNDNI